MQKSGWGGRRKNHPHTPYPTSKGFDFTPEGASLEVNRAGRREQGKGAEQFCFTGLGAPGTTSERDLRLEERSSFFRAEVIFHSLRWMPNIFLLHDS